MAKSLDLVGKRFGHLVVESRAENNKKNNTQWNCRCDCGNKKIALGYDLTHGRTTTCGCKFYLKDKPAHNRASLVGKKFGKLTVTSLNEEKSKDGVLVWNCICDCGNTFTARGGNLKMGKATHCGCSKPEFGNGFIDRTGQRYGRLVVLGIAYRKDYKTYWNCKCDCGNTCIAEGSGLSCGHTRSCGCLADESRKIPPRPRDLVYDRQSRLYAEWGAMKSRCSPTSHGHKNYYDIGIRVCDEWERFEAFHDWALANGYHDSLTLDRINVYGSYSPDNCRWVDFKAQANNKRNNVYVTIGDETKTLKQWSEFYGVSYPTVRARRNHGWPQSRWFEPSTKAKPKT